MAGDGQIKKPSDQALGMDASICRRDFLNAALVGAGAALSGSLTPAEMLAQQSGSTDADWDGPGGIGDYRLAHGNPQRVMDSAHAVRDGRYDAEPANAVDTGEIFDCIVVGGGLSGLAAALFLTRDRIGSAVRKCLILENHPIFGGAARRNEFEVDGQRLMAPQGATQFPIPLENGLIDRFYRDVGFDYWRFRYQDWGGSSPPMPLSRTVYALEASKPASYGIYFGAKYGQTPGKWVVDPVGTRLAGAPVSEEARRELLASWQKSSLTGSPPAKPLKYRGDEQSRWLDSMTLEEYFMREKGISRETIRTYISPGVAGGVGLGADVVSAFSQYAWAPAKDFSVETGLQQAPGGLTSLARHIVKTLIPDAIEGNADLHDVCRQPIRFEALDRATNAVRIRLNSTAVRVQHEGGVPYKSDYVIVVYARDGILYRARARSVIMAGGGWVTKHVVRDLPPELHEAYDQFHYGAFLRANVAVRNWRFLYRLGISGGSWFEGFGTGTSVLKAVTFGADSEAIGPDSPTVLTLDQPFLFPGLPIAAQGTSGRLQLLKTSFREYERQIRETLHETFGHSGLDVQRDIAGIVLNRWGHALLAPQPGFFFGKNGKPAPRDLLRMKPFGRIAFAHTDLGGAHSHVFAIREAQRAAEQILALVYTV